MLHIRQKILHITAFLILITVPVIDCLAEYNHEIGIAGGTSFYLGDANKSGLFNRCDFSFGGMYRYNIDTHWGVKLFATYNKVSGDTRDWGYTLPNGQEYACFERKYVSADATVEYNFFGIGSEGYYNSRYKATPYITIGVGLTAYNSLAEAKNVFYVNIPVGIGGKWKINKRFTLGLEWTIHKLFTDSFDVTGKKNRILDNPYNTGRVGFADTDWYSLLDLYFTVNLFNENKHCR